MLEISKTKELQKTFSSNNQNKTTYLLNKKAEVDTFQCSANKNKSTNSKKGIFNNFLNNKIGYNTNCTDGKDDGKLSNKEKFVSTLRGCLNCVTNVIDSAIEHPVITALSVGGTIGISALLIAGGIISAPMLAIGGATISLGFGILNIGKGINNAKNAQNDAEAKLAYENIGEGTSTALTSAFALGKGISTVKQIKEISSMADDIAKQAGKYADDATTCLKQSEEYVTIIKNTHSQISKDTSFADEIFDETTKLIDKSNKTYFASDLKRSKISYNNIKNATASDESIRIADDLLSKTKQYTLEARKHADSAKAFSKKVSKASSVKQAKKYKDLTTQAMEKTKSSTDLATDTTNSISEINNEITKKSKYISEELQSILNSFKEIDTSLSKVDYSNTSYVDDRIFGFDSSNVDTREDFRTKVEMNAGLSDDSLKTHSLDPVIENNKIVSQLKSDSKYSSLGEPRLNKKTQEYTYICENLKDMADGNGVRGKMPLHGKTKALKWRLGRIQEANISTIIDLRSKGECSQSAMDVMSELGLKYVNFPVEDCNWTDESVTTITSFIDAINNGDFYVGCANGEGRTDVAVAINYLLNPKANNVPDFYFGSMTTSRVSVKENITQIINIVKNNPEIVKEWGWNNYSDFYSAFSTRYKNVLNKFS